MKTVWLQFVTAIATSYVRVRRDKIISYTGTMAIRTISMHWMYAWELDKSTDNHQFKEFIRS